MEITHWRWYRTWRWIVTSVLFVLFYWWFIVRSRTQIPIKAEEASATEKSVSTSSFSLDERLEQWQIVYDTIEQYHPSRVVQALYGLCIAQLVWVYHHKYEELTLSELLHENTYPALYREILARMYQVIYQPGTYDTQSIQELALEVKRIVLSSTPQSWESASEK